MNDRDEIQAKSVPAVRRAVAILRLLAGEPAPQNLSQIARGTATLPSTALHILRELATARLVTIDPGLKIYRLGSGLIELAQAAARHSEFVDIVRPELLNIAWRFEVTAIATAALDVDHNACIASVSPPDAMSLNVTVGGRVPALAGAAGRCIAAFSDTPLPVVRQRFDRIRWQQPLGFDAWLAQVDQVRKIGFAEDDGLFARGVTTLAAPVFNRDGSVTRAIGIVTISAALEPGKRPLIAEALRNSAALIAARLAA